MENNFGLWEFLEKYVQYRKRLEGQVRWSYNDMHQEQSQEELREDPEDSMQI